MIGYIAYAKLHERDKWIAVNIEFPADGQIPLHMVDNATSHTLYRVDKVEVRTLETITAGVYNVASDSTSRVR